MDDSFTLLHTPDMDWENDPAIPGFKRRLLHVHPVTGGHIKQWYLPPAYGPAVGTLPHRHYHKSVTERAYHLSGDFPHWEFKNGADMDGELVVFKRHIFMDRPPFSIHGRFPEPYSQTGSEILYWNTGVGTGLGEPEAETETITVEFDESGRQDRTNFREASVFSTLDQPWLDHSQISDWKVKPLANKTCGTGEVMLVNIPMEARAPSGVAVSGSDDPHWLYVLSGDLFLRISTGDSSRDLSLSEGSFLRWDETLTLGFDNGPISKGGAVLICASHDLIQSFKSEA